MRMQMRRLTRLTSAHSKTLRHHNAATALHYGFCDLCRINEAVSITPSDGRWNLLAGSVGWRAVGRSG
jgi:hypothetical protein